MRYPRDSDIKSLSDVLNIEYQRVNVTGRNPDVDTGSSPEDLWETGGLWIPPLDANPHIVKSSVASDTGNLILSSKATSGGNNIVVDNTVDFIGIGVQVDDLILNDSTGIYSVINSVTTNTVTCEDTTTDPTFNMGDSYRIVRNGGAGASVLCLNFLRKNYSQGRIFVILNGTTDVIVNGIFRINGSFICGAASRSAINIGLITISDQTTGNITDQIVPSEGIGSTAVFSVPLGFTAYITSMSASILETSNAGASVSIAITRFGKTGNAGTQVVRLFDLSASGGNTATRPFEPMLLIPQLTDVIMRCATVSTNNVNVSGNFSIFLVKNA